MRPIAYKGYSLAERGVPQTKGRASLTCALWIVELNKAPNNKRRSGHCYQTYTSPTAAGGRGTRSGSTVPSNTHPSPQGDYSNVGLGGSYCPSTMHARSTKQGLWCGVAAILDLEVHATFLRLALWLKVVESEKALGEMPVV